MHSQLMDRARTSSPTRAHRAGVARARPRAALLAALLVQALVPGACIRSLSTAEPALPAGHPDGRQLQQQTCPIPGCAPGGAACSLTTGGKWSCTTCAAGRTLNAGGTECVCRAGSYPTVRGVCAQCPKDAFCPQAASNANPGATGRYARACPKNMGTRARGAANLKTCINKPGFYVRKAAAARAADSITAAAAPGYDPVTAEPCPLDTYSTGLELQTSCTPCPSGLRTDPEAPLGSYTSAEACMAPPGSFLAGDGAAAPCPQGEFSDEYSLATSCRACADVFGPGVTAAGAGANSSDACNQLEPGWALVDARGLLIMGPLQPGQTFARAAPCPQNYVCGGGDPAGGAAPQRCPRGMWTQVTEETFPEGELPRPGASSADQCVAPPGWFVPADEAAPIQECEPGTFKEGWDRSPACSPCGIGPWLSDATTTLLLFNTAAGEATSTVHVRGSSEGCFIQRGMGSIRDVGSRELKAVVCPSGFYGVDAPRYGAAAFPCLPCPANMVTSGTGNKATSYLNPDGSETPTAPSEGYLAVEACATQPGYGYEGTSQLCLPGFFSPGGDMQPCKPCPYGTTSAAAGAASVENCSLYEAGYGLSEQGSTAPCPVGSFSDGTAKAGVDACTPCGGGRTTGDVGATSEAACSFCAAGYGRVSGGGCAACGDGYFGPDPSIRGDDTRCWLCPSGRSYRFTWEVEDVFTPLPTTPPGSRSTSDCLANFAQTVDGGFYLDLRPGSADLATASKETLGPCVDACLDDDACAAATFDYASGACKLWKPNTRGASFASGGGMAFKAMLSAYVAASTPGSKNNKPAAAAGGSSHPAAASSDVQAKAMGSGMFTFWAGASAASALADSSRVNVAGATMLTDCLRECTNDNLCSGVVFGPLDTSSSALGTIDGAGVACQLIKASVTTDSRRTLIKAKATALQPV